MMGRNIFEVTSNPISGSKYCKIGRVHCFFLNSEGYPRITIGPHCM